MKKKNREIHWLDGFVDHICLVNMGKIVEFKQGNEYGMIKNRPLSNDGARSCYIKGSITGRFAVFFRMDNSILVSMDAIGCLTSAVIMAVNEQVNPCNIVWVPNTFAHYGPQENWTIKELSTNSTYGDIQAHATDCLRKIYNAIAKPVVKNSIIIFGSDLILRAMARILISTNLALKLKYGQESLGWDPLGPAELISICKQEVRIVR